MMLKIQLCQYKNQFNLKILKMQKFFFLFFFVKIFYMYYYVYETIVEVFDCWMCTFFF